MIKIQSITLEGYGVRLEPLSYEHQHELAVAAADGKLRKLAHRVIALTLIIVKLKYLPI